MARRKKQYSLFTFLGALIVVSVGLGLFVFVVAGVVNYSDENESPWDDGPPEAAGTIAAMIGAAFVGLDALRIGLHNSGVNAADARRRRDQQATQAKQEAEAERRRVEMLIGNAISAGRRAVESFAAMPGHLEGAKVWTQRAVECHKDNAYSPYWAAMESAYAEVAQYRAAVDSIEERSREHARCIADLSRSGNPVGELSVFPVQLDTSRVTRTIDEATANLNELAYQAQRDPTFAMIWEQRRTTAAVIAGFANLETAVAGMRSAVLNSLRSMERALRDGNDQTHQAVAGISRAVIEQGGAQVTALQSMAHRSNQIRDELYRQNWGHYPLLH